MLRFLRSGSKHTKTIWWVLIVVTVVTFLGGFVFIFGAGFDTTRSARLAGAVGSVNGQNITQAEYQNALNEQRENYRRQFGTDPADRDARVVELQAWRSLVTQRLVGSLAHQQGISAYDREVVLSLETSPPAALASSPSFQTDGKFDANKYEAALRNPGNNWAPFEDMIREQLPTKKFEQRLLASIKLSQPELHEEFRSRSERVTATFVQVPPSADARVPAPTPADLERVYQTHKSRFVSGLRVQLEALVVPHKYSDEDLRAARQVAQGLVDRARRGEDFAQLARDYSEGPAADKGGVIDRVLQPGEFGVMGEHMMTLKPGGISDAYQDGGRFLIFKLLESVPNPAGGPAGMKVAQIVIRSRPNQDALRTQFESLTKLRDRASRIGLGKAAAEKGMGTLKTSFYDQSTPPQELYTAPEASEWGLRAKTGQVSPVFQGLDEYVIVQVASRHEAGPATKEEIGDPLRQIAELEMRVDRAKSRADSLAALLAQGRTLDQAAQAVGLKPTSGAVVTRAQPDPRLAGAPELVGALFAAAPGRIVGPVRTLGGWYFGRVDERAMADSAAYENMKAQLSQEILTRRQQSFFAGFINQLLAKAKVQDLRYEGTP